MGPVVLHFLLSSAKRLYFVGSYTTTHTQDPFQVGTRFDFFFWAVCARAMCWLFPLGQRILASSRKNERFFRHKLAFVLVSSSEGSSVCVHYTSKREEKRYYFLLPFSASFHCLSLSGCCPLTLHSNPLFLRVCKSVGEKRASLTACESVVAKPEPVDLPCHEKTHTTYWGRLAL